MSSYDLNDVLEPNSPVPEHNVRIENLVRHLEHNTISITHIFLSYVEYGWLDCIIYLLTCPTTYDLIDFGYNNNYALKLAYDHNYTDILEFFFTDASTKNKIDFHTVGVCLFDTCRKGNTDFIEMCNKHLCKEKLKAYMYDMKSFLLACIYGNKNVLFLLIECAVKDDVSVTSIMRQTFKWLCKLNDVAAVKMIMADSKLTGYINSEAYTHAKEMSMRLCTKDFV